MVPVGEVLTVAFWPFGTRTAMLEPVGVTHSYSPESAVACFGVPAQLVSAAAMAMEGRRDARDRFMV